MALRTEENSIAVSGAEVGTRPFESWASRVLYWRDVIIAEHRFIFLVVLAAIVVSVVLSLILPPRYESSARLIVSSDSEGLMKRALAAGVGAATRDVALSGGGLPGLETGDQSAKFVAMMRSRTVEDRLVNRFELRKLYGTRLWMDARKVLEQRTDLKIDRKTSIITITVQDRDPKRAQQIAQGYIEELNRVAAEMDTSAAHRERVFLDARLVEIKQSLEKASQELGTFSSNNSMLAFDQQAKAMLESAATLQGQVAAADAQLKGLEQIYSDNNVRVRQLKAHIAELNRQMLNMRGTGAEPGDVTENGEPLFPSMRKLPTLGVKYLDLYRRNKVLEAAYNTLAQQHELAKVEEAKELPVVRVLDAPEYPELRKSPRRKLIVMVSTFAGFLVSIAFIVARKKWQGMPPEHPIRVLASAFARPILHHRYAVKLQAYRASLLRARPSADNGDNHS
jgi:uncharacterized protein involved in exopolysaccharide biosynthesis